LKWAEYTLERAAAMQLITVAAAFLLLMRVPETFKPEPRVEARVWLPRSLTKPGLATGFVNVHYPVIAGFLILHLARYGNSGPAAFSAYAGMMLLSRFFLGSLPDRMHPRITYYFGIAAMAAGLVIAATPSPFVAIAATALLGFGAGTWDSGGRIGDVLRSFCRSGIVCGGRGFKPLRISGGVLYGSRVSRRCSGCRYLRFSDTGYGNAGARGCRDS
jgi:MFS family permease